MTSTPPPRLPAPPPLPTGYDLAETLDLFWGYDPDHRTENRDTVKPGKRNPE